MLHKNNTVSPSLPLSCSYSRTPAMASYRGKKPHGPDSSGSSLEEGELSLHASQEEVAKPAETETGSKAGNKSDSDEDRPDGRRAPTIPHPPPGAGPRQPRNPPTGRNNVVYRGIWLRGSGRTNQMRGEIRRLQQVAAAVRRHAHQLLGSPDIRQGPATQRPAHRRLGSQRPVESQSPRASTPQPQMATDQQETEQTVGFDDTTIPLEPPAPPMPQTPPGALRPSGRPPPASRKRQPTGANAALKAIQLGARRRLDFSGVENRPPGRQLSLDGDLSPRQRTVLYGGLAVLIAAAYTGQILDWPMAVTMAAQQESPEHRRRAVLRAFIMLERLLSIEHVHFSSLEAAMRRISNELAGEVHLPAPAVAILQAVRRHLQEGKCHQARHG